jgi:hypothetical protein
VTRADPFSDFINQHLHLGDETFTPIDLPAPTDRRWHYGQYQASSTVQIYSQPNTHFAYGYALRATNGYAHAMLRYLPDIRPGWTTIELTIGMPIVGYVRNDSVNFRRSSGVYEYLLMLMNSALIVVGLSVLIFAYAIPRSRVQLPNSVLVESSPFEQRIERFIGHLEAILLPLQ